MKKFAICAVMVFALVIVQSASGLAELKSQDDSQLAIVKAYSVAHMPVWTSEHKFNDEMLVSYLQACATPKLWNAKGGTTSIKFYRANLKIVVSGSTKTHRAIEKMLDKFPRTEVPAPIGFQR